MCGFIDNIFSGDGLLSLVTTIGSVIPGPWQPVMLAVGAANNLSKGNLLGAGLGALGAAGGFADLGASIGGGASGGLQGIADVGNLMGGGGGITGGLGSTFGGAVGGLDDVFSGMSTSLPSVGGGSAIGASDVFNSFGDNMSGFLGESAGGGLGSMGGDLSASMLGAGQGLGGGISDFSGDTTGFGGLAGLEQGPNLGDSFGNSLDVMSNAGIGEDTNLLSSLTDIFGKTKDAINSPTGKLLGSGAKMLGAYGDYRGMRNAQNAYRDNLAELDQLYAPNSPYAKQMQQTLARRDAARGRNSQYGPRSQELAANLTKQRSNVMSSPSYLAQLGAVNQSAMPWASFGAAVPGFISGLGGLFK